MDQGTLYINACAQVLGNHQAGYPYRIPSVQATAFELGMFAAQDDSQL